jgi:hypothetical protein
VQRKYDVKEGDALTVVDLGGSVLLVLPGRSAVELHGQQVAAALEAAGMRTADVDDALSEERQRYYRERYAAPGSPGTPSTT